MKKALTISFIAAIGLVFIADATLAATKRKLQSTASQPSTSLSANIVLPDHIYCPAGQTCEFGAVSFLIIT